LVKETMTSLTDGEHIDCVVLDVDIYTEQFVIKYLLKEQIERLPNTELPEVNLKVIGKIELKEMNQRTRPKKKSKNQLKKERKERLQKDKIVESTI